MVCFQSAHINSKTHNGLLSISAYQQLNPQWFAFNQRISTVKPTMVCFQSAHINRICVMLAFTFPTKYCATICHRDLFYVFVFVFIHHSRVQIIQ